MKFCYFKTMVKVIFWGIISSKCHLYKERIDYVIYITKKILDEIYFNFKTYQTSYVDEHLVTYVIFKYQTKPY